MQELIETERAYIGHLERVVEVRTPLILDFSVSLYLHHTMFHDYACSVYSIIELHACHGPY